MTDTLNILTFNWHEAYICTLAKTGQHFDIVERFKGGSKEWFYKTRPVPKNGDIIPDKSAHVRCKNNMYDVIICHNFKDLAEIADYDIPKLLVFHNKLTTELALGKNKHSKKEYLDTVLETLGKTTNLHLVFISEAKKEDWELDGTVITPGIDTSEYDNYKGDELKALRVGNFMKMRDVMMGYYDQEKILKDIPNTMLGLNDPAPNARFTTNWKDLKDQFKSHRVYLNTTVDGYEDGYNLAMLEAMATGMPVVSTDNSSSPLKDGFDGYISKDLGYLSDKIRYLFDNKDKAIELGANARKTIEEKFNIGDFADKWNTLFNKVESSEKKKDKIRIFENSQKKRILLNYVSYPVTTARHIEDSLRKFHHVITCGPAINQEIIKIWNLKKIKEKVTPHDMPCDLTVNIKEIVKQIPDREYPDLYLWIESVCGNFPEGISDLPFPTACYMIDSHKKFEWQLKWAVQFDTVFLAQQEYIPNFEKAGCRNVKWLPLACDSFFHRKHKCKKDIDIGFVGSITEHEQHQKRKRLLDKLSEKFSVRIKRCFLEDMAKIFSRSKIIFNDAIKNDLNMRVFEVMGTGSMLLTDEAPGSGLNNMFENKKHLVIYNEENIIELAEYYLSHDKEREKIAKAGMQEVLEKHTYDHRARELVDSIFTINKQTDIISSKEETLLKKGVESKEKNELETAIINFRAVLDMNIDNELALTCLIETAETANRLDISEKYLAKFMELHPANLDRLLSLGEIRLSTGKRDDAKRDLEKVLMFDPNNERAKKILNNL